MKTLQIALLGTSLLPMLAGAQTIRLGALEVTPGQKLEFPITLSPAARIEAAKFNRKAETGTAALAVPSEFSLNRNWPVLIVSVPSGGSAVRHLDAYLEPGLSEKWVLFAADGPPTRTEEDSTTWRWSVLSSALDFLHRSWPQSKSWPVACVGFSGGAKMSAFLASNLVRANYQTIGVFMGGCNEDRATLGFRMNQPGERFKWVPMFLSSGKTDHIATPEQHAGVQQSLTREGFRRIRLESYPGGHRLETEHVRLALQWFISLQPTAQTTSASPTQPARTTVSRPGTERGAQTAKLLEWQKREAEQGRASAQYSLGMRYLSGDGVPQDEELGRQWLTKAARQGDNEAYLKLKNSDFLSEQRDPTGRVVRSTVARHEFRAASGYPKGRLGYVIVHVRPIDEGGCDCPENLRWEIISEARERERWP